MGEHAKHSDERTHVITGVGMLPDKPMARCSECDSWSYMAALEGRCLACATAVSGREQADR